MPTAVHPGWQCWQVSLAPISASSSSPGDAEICYVENGHLLDGPARWEALPVGWSWLGRWAGTSRVSDGGILILRVDSGAKE